MTLSVILATTHPWPAARDCLRILAPQAAQCGAEILLADSTGAGFPADPPPDLASVRHLVLPGASIFALRAHATNHARCSVIAWTEDHCLPSPDWCRSLLDAQRANPDALFICGAVHNASTASLLDWANFLTTFATFLPPFDPRRNFRAPVAANLSFKRSALPPAPLAPGEMEFHLLPTLWRAGHCRFDSTLTVHHVQSHGWPGTPWSHFHNGRSTTGMRASQVSLPGKLAHCALSFALPPIYLAHYLRAAAGKPVPWLRALPLVALLISAHAAGQLAGLLTASPGRSPLYLE